MSVDIFNFCKKTKTKTKNSNILIFFHGIHPLCPYNIQEGAWPSPRMISIGSWQESGQSSPGELCPRGGTAVGLGFPRKETKVKAPGSGEAAEMLGWALSHLISRETYPTPPHPRSSRALGPAPSRKAQSLDSKCSCPSLSGLWTQPQLAAHPSGPLWVPGSPGQDKIPAQPPGALAPTEFRRPQECSLP